MSRNNIKIPQVNRALTGGEIWRPCWHDMTQVRDPEMMWLDKNENPDQSLRLVVEDIMRNMPMSVISTYPELPPLYKSLSNFLGVDPENLVLANGSDGVIRCAFDCFVDRHDTVIHTSPTYAMYSVYCQVKGANELAFNYDWNGQCWSLNWEDIFEKTLQLKPKLVCVPTPDSPTGAIIENDRLDQLITICEQVGALLIIDEAYFPFHEKSAIDRVSFSSNILVTRSTGKAWGLAGLRVGFGIGSPELIQKLQTIRSMYECNSVAAYVFNKMISQYGVVKASVERLKAGLTWFESAMIERGFETIPPAANFIHVAFGERESQIAENLSNLIYYRRETPHPSLAGYSRFSATTEEQFRKIVEVIDV